MSFDNLVAEEYKVGMGGYQKCVHQEPIQGLRVLVSPNETWTFPVNEIRIEVLKCTKYGIKECNVFRFLVCFQYFMFSFHYMCSQARLRL